MLKSAYSEQMKPAAADSEAANNTGFIVFAILVMFTYYVFKNLVFLASMKISLEALFVAPAIVGLVFAFLTYDDTPPSYRILLRSIGTIAIFYLAFGRFSTGFEDAGGPFLGLSAASFFFILVLALGLIGLFSRPSLLIVPVYYMLYYKLELVQSLQLSITLLDFFTIVETGGMLVLIPIVWWLVRALLARLQEDELNAVFAGDKSDFFEYAILAGVALHFGNYFVSGIAKVYLGETFYFWSFFNPTEYLVLIADDNGVLPISFSEQLVRTAYEHFTDMRPITNTLTLVGQIICVFAIMRISWAIAITLFYDLMHIAIAVMSGIFFWKFIALNAAIVVSLRWMKLGRLQLNLWGKWFLTGCVIVSAFIFDIGVFAWLDTRSLNQYRVYAITDQGKELEVPSNYFLDLSVTFAQNRVVWPRDRAFETMTWGTTHSMDAMRVANRCELPLVNGTQKIAPFFVPKEHITKLLKWHHRRMLALVDEKGYFNYDFFPHHIFSVPWRYTSFKQLDKRTIVSYRFTGEALCLSMGASGPVRDVKSEADFVVDVTGLKLAKP